MEFGRTFRGNCGPQYWQSKLVSIKGFNGIKIYIAKKTGKALVHSENKHRSSK